MDDCFLKKKQCKRQFLNVKSIDSCGKECAANASWLQYSYPTESTYQGRFI